MKNENKDSGEVKGEMRDRGVRGKKKKIQNNAAQASGLNDSATGSRHRVSAKLYTEHANCNILAFQLTSISITINITIETRTADPHSQLGEWHPERKG